MKTVGRRLFGSPFFGEVAGFDIVDYLSETNWEDAGILSGFS
jgi:hypothetical protein